MNNVVFLDFNGVISNGDNFFGIEQIAVLKGIIKKYDAKVVVISSVVKNATKEDVNDIKKRLSKFGISNVDTINPNFEGRIDSRELPSLVLGIVDYIKIHNPDKYTILDDRHHKEYDLLNLNHHKVDGLTGLTEHDYKNIELLKNESKFINYVYYSPRVESNIKGR